LPKHEIPRTRRLLKTRYPVSLRGSAFNLTGLRRSRETVGTFSIMSSKPWHKSFVSTWIGYWVAISDGRHISVAFCDKAG